MSKVIVGVEPDEPEQPALRWAVSYAAATGAGLTLVTAWEPGQAELPPERYEELEQQVEVYLRRELGEVEHELHDPLPYEIQVGTASMHDTLAEAAERDDTELLVLGHPDAGLVPRLSSVALRLANRVPVPVVFAQGATPHVGADGALIAAVDGADADEAVLGWAAHVAQATGQTVEAVYAKPTGAESYPHPTGATEADQAVEAIVDELQAGATGGGDEPSVRLEVVQGGAEEVLTRLADRAGSGLVILGRGRGPLLDKVPAHLAEAGKVTVAVVPAKPRPAHRWRLAVGLAETVAGWVTADRRLEAKGDLDQLAAAGAGQPGPDDPEAVRQAELDVRRSHGDLAPGTD